MFKRPESVLVVIHRADGWALLLERAGHAGYWQSVTGSLEENETPFECARREVHEETGIVAQPVNLADWRLTNCFEIFAEWRHRYAPGVTHNLEHVFSLTVAADSAVTLAASEHRAFQWLPGKEAASKCFSWSNRDALLMLAHSRL